MVRSVIGGSCLKSARVRLGPGRHGVKRPKSHTARKIFVHARMSVDSLAKQQELRRMRHQSACRSAAGRETMKFQTLFLSASVVALSWGGVAAAQTPAPAAAAVAAEST